MKKISLSVVIPIYNEEKILPKLQKRLLASLTKTKSRYEIIYIDDGSSDNSPNTIRKFSKEYESVRGIIFSRNFGHMSAVEAGLKEAKGEFVVLMDGDLQDPPELIPSLLKEAKKGYQVVYGIKKNRKEPLVRKTLLNNYYKLLNIFLDYKMPENAGTFSIMHKDLVNILNNMPEKNKYISGLRSWVGFSQTGIVYKRGKRDSGSPMPFRKLFKLALDGLFSFSYMPLKLASIMGFIFATVSFLFIAIVMILRVFFNAGILGWASTLSVILFIGGVQLITLGVIGEYLSRIYDEVKGRPRYIIREKIKPKVF